MTKVFKPIVAACAGNLFEWYDFTVYALFATYLAKSFFPSAGPAVGLVKTFLTFGAGFIIRPLGALLIGAYGDRAGRKAALTLSIWIMAAGTLLIAAAPSYATIGVGAPLLLLLGRLLQGFSAGGEIGNASAFLAESATADARGGAAAWLQASMGMSNILGALVAFTVTATLNPDQLQRWGWRIPFAIGLLIVPVGVLLRRSISETAAFSADVARRRKLGVPRQSPLRQVWGPHRGALGVGFGLAVFWAVAVYVLNIYTPVYVQLAFKYSAQQAFAASLMGNVLFVTSCVVAGRLSDRVGRSTVLGGSALALLVTVLPLYLWLQQAPSTAVLITVFSLFGIMVAGFVGVAPGAMSDLFPIGVRATGIALVYNGAFTVFGGFAPAILTWFTRQSHGSPMAPAEYVMAAAVVALLTLPLFRQRCRTEPAEPKGTAAPTEVGA